MEKSNEIYIWILDFLKNNGRYPKLREIGAHYGFTRERARQIIDKLEKEGYVVRTLSRKWGGSFAIDAQNIVKNKKVVKNEPDDIYT